MKLFQHVFETYESGHKCYRIWHVRLEYKLQDFWIGVFWKRERNPVPAIDIWVCILPCFPIHFYCLYKWP